MVAYAVNDNRLVALHAERNARSEDELSAATWSVVVTKADLSLWSLSHTAFSGERRSTKADATPAREHGSVERSVADPVQCQPARLADVIVHHSHQVTSDTLRIARLALAAQTQGALHEARDTRR